MRGGLRLFDRDEDVADRADQPNTRSGLAFLGDRVKPVLRVELVPDTCGAQRHTGNGPITIAVGHGAVGVNGLMRSVERTDSEMNDTNCSCTAIIFRASDIGGQCLCRGLR